eukprot:8888_1
MDDDELEMLKLRNIRQNAVSSHSQDTLNDSRSNSKPVSSEASTEEEMEQLRHLFPMSFGQTKNVKDEEDRKKEMTDHSKFKRSFGSDIRFDPRTQRTSVPLPVLEEPQDDLDEVLMAVDGPATSSSSSGKHPESEASLPVEGEIEDPNPLRLPITHEVSLKGHSRLVSALSLDPSGARLVTGSYDNNVKMWDFGGMDSHLRSFRQMTPSEGHSIMSVKWSPTGDRFLVCPGSSIAKVYDRDGYAVCETVKGDMYIRDMTHTFGHVTGLTGGCWHPSDKNQIMTWSSDGTLRLWDLEKLKRNLKVVKLRSNVGGRHSCTAGAFSPDGKTIVAASIDGSLQMWPARNPLRPKIIKGAHTPQSETSGLVVASDCHTLYSRGGDDTVKIWDMRKFKEAVQVISELPNDNMHTNVILSPDQKYVVTGTSTPKDEGVPGKLVFISRKQQEVVHSTNVSEASVVRCEWNGKINQIIASGADNLTHVFYDPDLSRKGALLCAKKIVKRAIVDIIGHKALGNIIAPTSQRHLRRIAQHSARKQKYLDRKDPIKSKRPELPIVGPAAAGRIGNTSFSQMVVRNTKRHNFRDEDPREALLRYEDKTKSDPMFLGHAYAKTQPGTYLDTNEYDEEGNIVEPKKKRQKYS